YVSTNCGSSWTRVFQAGENSTGTLATASTNTNAFVPANSGEWCMGTVGSDCFNVDLTAFVGNEVLIMFEGFNSGTIGNNLYLDNINITGVTAPLSANFTASSQAICTGESITFSDNSTGTFTSQSWSFPGGSPNSSSVSNPSVTFNTPGTYNVSYTITGPNGSDTEVKNNFITVNASPSVSITGNSSVCLNGSTFLTANAAAGSGTISAYQWYLNGTPIGSNSNTLNATSTGSYTVEVSNSTNCTATSNSFNLGLAALPTVTLTGGGAYCAGDFTTLTAVASTPSGTISNYEWYNGGSVVANGPSNTYNASSAGTYSVIVSNSAGCNAQSNPINVAAPTNSPNVSISGNTTICPNGTTTLTGTVATGSGSIVNYEWFRNGVSTGNNSTSLFTSQGGIYELRATNSAGCSGTSTPITVSVESPFVVGFTTSDASCGSTNGSASATVNGSSAGYSFLWSTSPAVNSANINGIGAGIYQVEVTNNSTGCITIASVQINNIGAPVIDSSYVTQSTCDNGNLGAAGVFISGGTGTYTYNWGTGLPNASSVNNLSPGNYVLNVVDQAQCLVSFGFTIINAVAPTIDTAILSDATCSGVNNGTIDLVLSGGSGSYSYQWSTGEISQDISNLSAGSYTLILTDDLTNCEATSTYTIENSFTLSNNFVIVDNSASQGNSNISASAAGGVSPYTYSWNNGDLSGAFIDSLSGGDYVLTVQDANNCLLLDTASIGFVGIAEQSPIQSILLYPNPTSDALQLDLELEEKATVNLSIINSLGQQIWSSIVDGFESGKINLPSRSLSAGIYHVQIQIDESTKIVRFVKVN
ncbi:MAG: PKD domain-containing protein, partial [Bacteroidetes bacterium]|nr:PKD domain-containing protein [Bacteroidota bacterium]